MRNGISVILMSIFLIMSDLEHLLICFGTFLKYSRVCMCVWIICSCLSHFFYWVFSILSSILRVYIKDIRFFKSVIYVTGNFPDLFAVFWCCLFFFAMQKYFYVVTYQSFIAPGFWVTVRKPFLTPIFLPVSIAFQVSHLDS